jgi:hypothetical protein
MLADHPIRTAKFVKGIRWTARSLAAIGVPFCGFCVGGVFIDAYFGPVRRPMPFVLEGAPFGTHAQSTHLGILTLGAGFVLSFVGVILAFRWEAIAARILLASGVVQTFLWAMWLRDRTAPSYSHWDQLTLSALPPFVIAILLLVISRSPSQTQGSAGGKAATSSLTPK